MFDKPQEFVLFGSMNNSFRIALAQINTTVGDLAGNYEKILNYSRKAESEGADLIAFPELALPGYPPEDLLYKKSFNKDISKFLKKLTNEKLKPILVVGYPCMDKTPTNSAAVIYNNKLLASVDKFCLPNYGVFDEHRYFLPAQKGYIFDLGFMRFGVSICEDIWVSPGITEVLTLNGANLVINISSSPYHVRKNKYRRDVIKRLARSNCTYLAYCNLVGGQDELVFDGNSMVFLPDGELFASGKPFEEDLVIADIIPSALTSKQFNISVPKDIPPVDVIEIRNFKPVKKTNKLRPMIYGIPRQEKEIYKALVLGTSDYITKNGFSDILIGLSGGIDSALTAAIAYDAVGPERLHLVFMPSKFTSKESHRDASKLAQNMGIELVAIPIDVPFGQYKDLLADQFKGRQEDITEENLQARIRGNLLMALSNKFGWLVLTTGNKSEVSVGYSTLYGDTAGGFAAIKDVYKTLVFKLARYFNRKEEKTIIPKSIISKPPSAELRENQKDSDSLPPYDILDPILKLYIEKDMDQKEIIAQGYNRKDVKRIIRLVDLAEYKRRQSPPGIKITPKAFGRDRRMPITQKYFS
jgi:NAD+ synthase (glutamine-hydrolysing)